MKQASYKKKKKKRSGDIGGKLYWVYTSNFNIVYISVINPKIHDL